MRPGDHGRREPFFGLFFIGWAGLADLWSQKRTNFVRKAAYSRDLPLKSGGTIESNSPGRVNTGFDTTTPSPSGTDPIPQPQILPLMVRPGLGQISPMNMANARAEYLDELQWIPSAQAGRVQLFVLTRGA